MTALHVLEKPYVNVTLIKPDCSYTPPIPTLDETAQ